MRDYEQVRGMMRQAEHRYGGPDILVNNAGIGFFNVEKMPPEQWRATVETNLSGVFYCCREVIPLMKRRGGGYIINIGSLAGKNAFPGGAAYNATKFGLIGFSEALMQEVRYDHIRVGYVMPGSVNTEFGRFFHRAGAIEDLEAPARGRGHRCRQSSGNGSAGPAQPRRITPLRTAEVTR